MSPDTPKLAPGVGPQPYPAVTEAVAGRIGPPGPTGVGPARWCGEGSFLPDEVCSAAAHVY